MHSKYANVAASNDATGQEQTLNTSQNKSNASHWLVSGPTIPVPGSQKGVFHSGLMKSEPVAV